MNPYKRAVLGEIERLLSPHAPVGRMLAFGAGDGWFTERLLARGLVRSAVPVDVLLRRRRRLSPVLYDGERLPFADGTFDLVLAVDVLHHCPSPEEALREALRCTRDLFLLKDHTHSGPLGRWTLALLDEIGNRRFGVPSLYRYQRGWEWLGVVEGDGFAREALVHPARCEPRPPLSWFVNRLQFLGLWRRVRSARAAGAPGAQRPLLAERRSAARRSSSRR